MSKDRPRGRAEVVEALLESARKLIAERGPSSVPLREIADDAGVNFGLLYQYIGTRDQLLHDVFDRTAVASAAKLMDVEHLDDAIDMLMQFGDGTTARLVGWAALEGKEQEAPFGPSPAIRLLADLAERDARDAGADLSREEAQVFAALAMSITLGWRLFGPISLVAADLDGNDHEHHTLTVRRLLQRFVHATTEPAPEERRSTGRSEEDR